MSLKLSLNHVSHEYDIEVLHDISLELEGFSSIAIIGVSGSGKSTLLRLLSGLEVATSGSLFVNGHHVQDDEYKQKVGFVFQSHTLFPHLTLLENITLVLEKTRGYSEKEAREVAVKNLKLVHLLDQMDKLPGNVSGGQAQRASIARALSINPDIVFLDEPTSALDPILTHEVLEALEELSDIGKQFIFVTHEMGFVRHSADYIFFLHEGVICEHGTVDILDKPKTEELKNFMEKVK
jgi:ABC-type polar amino acid transport system ATPase subunit